MEKYAFICTCTEYASAAQGHNLPHVQQDIDFWKQKLEEVHCYKPSNIVLLQNCDFTALNFFVHMYKLAAIAKKGDVITIFFMTHGVDIAGDKSNKRLFSTYDNFITDAMLYYLLHAFAVGVRIGFVTDCCLAGRAFENKPFILDDDDNDYINQLLHSANDTLKSKILEVYTLGLSIPLGASVWHLSSSYKDTSVSLNYFLQINKAVYNDIEKNPAYTLHRYTKALAEWAKKAAPKFYATYLNSIIKKDHNDVAKNAFIQHTGIDLSNNEQVLSVGDAKLGIEKRQLITKKRIAIEKTINENYKGTQENLGYLLANFEGLEHTRSTYVVPYPQVTILGAMPEAQVRSQLLFQ